MSPNQGTKNDAADGYTEAVKDIPPKEVFIGSANAAERRLVGYRGRWYDVSSFASKHPGGEIIEHFIGHDATQVMDSMHKFDVVALRKSVGCYSYEPENFGKDMSDLESKLRREGFYEESSWWYLGKCAQTASVLVLNVALVSSGVVGGSLAGGICCGVLLALFWQQSGMLMHDFMHTQLTRERKWDERAGILFGTLGFGISARWWKDEHMVHHSLTNTVDLVTGFVDPQALEDAWAQNEKLFAFHDTRLHAALIKIQHITFLPLCTLVGRAGIMIDSMRTERRKDVWVAWVLHWVWVSVFLSCFDSWSNAFLVYGMGCLGEGVLHIQLLLNHYCKRFFYMSEKHDMDHYRAMIECNLNIVCPPWMDWFHGGLNFHHEHHCFPRLPRNRLREVSALIREICERHNVKYDEMHFFDALWKTLRNLYAVRNKFLALRVDG